MRYCLLIVAVLLTGCITDGGPQRSSASGLAVDVEVQPSVLARGETLHVRITVKNESDAPVVRHFASGCIYGFALWSEEGELVAPPPPICTMNAPTVRYAPGETVNRKFQWVWDDPDIGPGTYLLVAGIGRRGEVESAPAVTVRLR